MNCKNETAEKALLDASGTRWRWTSWSETSAEKKRRGIRNAWTVSSFCIRCIRSWCGNENHRSSYSSIFLRSSRYSSHLDWLRCEIKSRDQFAKFIAVCLETDEIEFSFLRNFYAFVCSFFEIRLSLRSSTQVYSCNGFTASGYLSLFFSTW